MTKLQYAAGVGRQSDVWSERHNFPKGLPTYNDEWRLVATELAEDYHVQERTGGGADRVKYNVKFESKSDNYREFEGRAENKLPELRVPSSWQKFNCEVGLHPTQKPVALMEYLIRTYTDEGSVVLDNTMGSGTTGVACRNTGRKFIGIEQDAAYFATAKARIEADNDNHAPDLFASAA